MEKNKVKLSKTIDNMTDKEIIKAFEEYDRSGFVDLSDEEISTYDKLWLAYNQLDANTTWNEKDKIKYPKFGWINGNFKGLEFLNSLTNALNKLDGIKASGGTVYDNCAYHNSKIIWTIQFENIEIFSHFLWAGCFRYMPITHNDKWLITPDIGDPHYHQDKIIMDFCYQDLNAEREEWEEDVKDMTSCILKYVEHQNDIIK